MAALKPMLAKDSGMKPPRVEVDPNRWTMEPKLDGIRLIWSRTASGGMECYSGRNGRQIGPPSRQINEALSFLPPGTMLDGELLKFGYVPTERYEAWFFDVLSLGGKDVTKFPWTYRRSLLEEIAEQFDSVSTFLVPTVTPDQAVYERWVEDGLEGVVLKHVDSTYRKGSRTQAWTKLKPQEDGAEAIAIGWEYGQGESNGSRCGALKVKLLKTGQETSCSYDTTPEKAEAKVGHMLELRHHGWTKHGKVRHPIFLRWRPDRDGEGESADAGTEGGTMDLEDLAATIPEVPDDVVESPDSPIRSGAGNIRNVRQMGDQKLAALYEDMKEFEQLDPPGYQAVREEAERRGLATA